MPILRYVDKQCPYTQWRLFSLKKCKPQRAGEGGMQPFSRAPPGPLLWRADELGPGTRSRFLPADQSPPAGAHRPGPGWGAAASLSPHPHPHLRHLMAVASPKSILVDPRVCSLTLQGLSGAPSPQPPKPRSEPPGQEERSPRPRCLELRAQRVRPAALGPAQREAQRRVCVDMAPTLRAWSGRLGHLVTRRPRWRRLTWS